MASLTYWDTVPLWRFERHLRKVGREYYGRLLADYRCASVLDVGCGFGETEAHVGPVRYVGLDQTRRLLHGGLVNGKAEALPFPAHSFDMVTARCVLEHIVRPWDALAEMRRVARRCIVLVWFIEPANRRRTVVTPAVGHVNCRHSALQLRQAMKAWNLTEAFDFDRHVVWVWEAP